VEIPKSISVAEICGSPGKEREAMAPTDVITRRIRPPVAVSISGDETSTRSFGEVPSR
jgi:hypothetical protein